VVAHQRAGVAQQIKHAARGLFANPLAAALLDFPRRPSRSAARPAFGSLFFRCSERASSTTQDVATQGRTAAIRCFWEAEMSDGRVVLDLSGRPIVNDGRPPRPPGKPVNQ
jgi:hypothetical protein